MTDQEVINASMAISFVSLGVSLLTALGQCYLYFTDPKRSK